MEGAKNQVNLHKLGHSEGEGGGGGGVMPEKEKNKRHKEASFLLFPSRWHTRR